MPNLDPNLGGPAPSTQSTEPGKRVTWRRPAIFEHLSLTDTANSPGPLADGTGSSSSAS